MRILLIDYERAELLSQLKNKFGSYAEASRNLGLSYVFLKNWLHKGGCISKKDFNKILKGLNLSAKSLSFETFEKRQDLAAKTKSCPNPKITVDLVHQIEQFKYGFSLNEFDKLGLETLLEFYPNVIRILFLAAKNHFGSTAKLYRYLNFNETTCRDYLKKGVKHMQVRRISPLVRLLRNYGLTKIPSSCYEEVKGLISLDDIEHFIKHGIKCTGGLNPKRIVETYSRIYESDAISLRELVSLSDERIGEFAKIEYRKRAIRHLLSLGLIKRRRDSSKRPISYKYGSTRRLTPKQFGFIVRYPDNISLEKLQKILYSPSSEEKNRMMMEIAGFEEFIISEGVPKGFYEKAKIEYSKGMFESMVKCIRTMPYSTPDKKLETFIEHAYPILECLKQENNSVGEFYKCLETKLHKKVDTLVVLRILKFYEEIGKIVFDPQSKIYSLRDCLNSKHLRKNYSMIVP